MRYTYLDPEKRHRVSDPTLKAIQKKALLSFYERHHQTCSSSSSWRSEPQLTQSSQAPPPQPPPRPRLPSSRRASSASDYATGNPREKITKYKNSELPSPKHQHSNSCGTFSTDLLGPVIVGPTISIDDWVPERPPKKPHLRNYNERLPSPDLPPPSPPTITENEVICDDPLPPPPELSDNSDSNRSEQKISSPRKLKSKSDRNKQDVMSCLIENHHSHYGETTQRNYYALLPKYVDPLKLKATQCLSERSNDNTSSNNSNLGSSNSPPPPLAPRQNTTGRKSLPPQRPTSPHVVHR